MKLPNFEQIKEKTKLAYQKSSKKGLVFSHISWGIYYASSLYFYPSQTYNFERFILDYSLSYGIFISSYAIFVKYEKPPA